MKFLTQVQRGPPAALRLADHGAVTTRILELVLANVLMLVLGCRPAAVPPPRADAARAPHAAPLGYAVGLAATGILAADLARRLRAGRADPAARRWRRSRCSLGLRRVSGARPGRAGEPIADASPRSRCSRRRSSSRCRWRGCFAVKPLLESDGWEIWATRARALYEFGHPAAPVFTDPIYPALQHPLLLPGLEAVDFRFMGAFDGTLVHLQLLGLAIGFVGGAWTLLRGTTRPMLLAATLLALVTAPTFFNQLQTNYADIPLAMFIALGVAALATLAADRRARGCCPRRRSSSPPAR